MAMTYTKPQSARQIEARSRAKSNGVRVEVVNHAAYYTTRSKSQPGTVHHMSRNRAGQWTCTCPGHYWTGVCKHLGQLERRSERESWPFGKIAPRGFTG